MSTDTRTLRMNNVTLGPIVWGAFTLRIEGKNSRGNPQAVSLEIPWVLWPLLCIYAMRAWSKEREARADEIREIDLTFGHDSSKQSKEAA